MKQPHPELPVRFYRSASGNEPVREWLLELKRSERKAIGDDIRTMQFTWPTGMPLVEKVEPELWTVRSRLVGRIARVFFTIEDGMAVLLHGIIKKTNRLGQQDLETARQRLKQLKHGERNE